MKRIWLAAAAAIAIAGCGKAGEKAAADAAPAQEEAASLPEEAMTGAERKAAFEKVAAENLAASKAFLADNAKRDGVKETKSGLQYMVLDEGAKDGLTPVSTDLVTVHYVGTLKDGFEFDSSRARGAAAQFRLNQVISGWTEGVQLMREGARYRFFIPPELAYGPSGSGEIGPNEALIFDVELIKIQSAARNLAEAEKFLAGNAKKAGVKTTASGLQYEIVTKGKDGGKAPTADDTVTIQFEGSLANGTIFASSYDTGTPAEFPLSAPEDDWTSEALQLMHEGDKFRFFIPPGLAFGERGTPNGVIGPNEALVFEIELVSVK
ncbi:MAG: FKBP-type peptidyl-prolyl cis-trans isomerase [Parvularculaceae bacterium]